MPSQSSAPAGVAHQTGRDKGNPFPTRRGVSSHSRGPWALALAVAFGVSGCALEGARVEPDSFAAGLAVGLVLALPLMRWSAREARGMLAVSAREELERLRAVVRTFRRWVREWPSTRIADPAVFERLQEAEAALLELDVMTRPRPRGRGFWREEPPAPAEPPRFASWELASLGPLPVSDRWARRCRDRERDV